MAPNMEADLVRWSLGADGREPRLAHLRVILFFWPIRASSCHHSSISTPGSRRALISANWAGKFFKILDHIFVAYDDGAARDFPVPHLAQRLADGALIYRDAKFLIKFLSQIAATPLDNTVGSPGLVALDQLGEKSLVLGFNFWGATASGSSDPPGPRR